MQPTLACIVSSGMYRPMAHPPADAHPAGPRQTPFGPSGEIFSVGDGEEAFYLLPKFGSAASCPAPARCAPTNPRANLYALKDLGVRHVVEWAPVSAITHDIAVGELVLPVDLIDQTTRGAKTMIEGSPLGGLRQFPVFCPALRAAGKDVLHEAGLRFHDSATAAVTDGPRMATPAEIRFLGHVHVHLITHAFVPAAFLAKELQLCYAPIGYVADYAETGSRHRPFGGPDLFGGITHDSTAHRLAAASDSRDLALPQLARHLRHAPHECPCDTTMADLAREFGLSEDWHDWFA